MAIILTEVQVQTVLQQRGYSAGKVLVDDDGPAGLVLAELREQEIGDRALARPRRADDLEVAHAKLPQVDKCRRAAVRWNRSERRTGALQLLFKVPAVGGTAPQGADRRDVGRVAVADEIPAHRSGPLAGQGLGECAQLMGTLDMTGEARGLEALQDLRADLAHFLMGVAKAQNGQVVVTEDAVVLQQFDLGGLGILRQRESPFVEAARLGFGQRSHQPVKERH